MEPPLHLRIVTKPTRELCHMIKVIIFILLINQSINLLANCAKKE